MPSEINKTIRDEQPANSDPGGICVVCAASGLIRPGSQQHHIAGRHHDPGMTAPLCVEHHAALHALMRDFGADLQSQPNFLDRLIQMLRAVGAFLLLVARAILAWAELLWAELLRTRGGRPDA